MTSKIEWTGETWNPVTGCTKISPGCKHCYAETLAKRLKAMRDKAGYQNGFKLTLQPTRLDIPVKRKKPTTYFVCSMSDLFHADVPDGYIDSVFYVIRQTPQHTYQIFTKRAEQLPRYFEEREVPANTWIGVSVENWQHELPRIDYLRRVNARVRFLSIEPLLEDLEGMDLARSDWVIVGGESGSKARPIRREWVESIQRQADANGVKFFFQTVGRDGAQCC